SGDKRPDGPVNRVVPRLEADTETDTRLAGRLDHRAAVRLAQRHRLLDEHVLARRDRDLGLAAMLVVWRGDENGVDRGGGRQVFDRRVDLWRTDPLRERPPRGLAAADDA